MKIRINSVLLGFLIVAMLINVGALGYVAATPKSGKGFTEFYLLGLKSKAEDYPSEFVVGQEGRVIVGIINQEKRMTSYRIEVRIGETRKRVMEPIILANDDKYESVATFSPDSPGLGQKVEFLLYKDEEIAPYLTLFLLVSVTSP